MEWLLIVLPIAVVVGAVVWLAGRSAQRRRRAAWQSDEDPHAEVSEAARSGPRLYDIRGGGGPDDGGDGGA